MQVTILRLSQDVSFETGETLTYITLQLPTGALMRALIDEQASQQLTMAFVRSGSAASKHATQQAQAGVVPVQPPPHAPMRQAPQRMPDTQQYSPLELTENDSDETAEFGGDYDEEDQGGLAAIGEQLQAAEASLAASIGDTSTLGPAELREAADRLRNSAPLYQPSVQEQQRRRPLRVNKDEMGNPVLAGPGYIDVTRLVGGEPSEENEVGQV
jgi:hypothetical protein